MRVCVLVALVGVGMGLCGGFDCVCVVIVCGLLRRICGLLVWWIWLVWLCGSLCYAVVCYARFTCFVAVLFSG